MCSSLWSFIHTFFSQEDRLTEEDKVEKLTEAGLGKPDLLLFSIWNYVQ